MMTRINLLWLVLFFVLVSCKVKQSAVNKLPPQTIELQKYSLDSIYKEPIRLVENMVFLWKPEGQMTDLQVRDMQMLSREMDQLEVEQKEIEAPLQELKNAYEIEIAKLDEQQKQEWLALPEKVTTAQGSIDLATSKLNVLNENLKVENLKLDNINNQLVELGKSLEEEKNKADSSQDKLKEITEMISVAEADKVTIEKSILTLQKNQKKYAEKLQKAQVEYEKYQNEKTQDFNDVNACYSKVMIEEARIATEKQTLSEHGNALVQKMTENVDLMEKPNFLNIKAVDGLIQVELSWKIHPDCSNCEENFSTELHNLQNVIYQEAGGLLKFELVDSQGTYFFNLVRAADDDKRGRIFYNGDITVNNLDGTFRYGVLKFISGKY